MHVCVLCLVVSCDTLFRDKKAVTCNKSIHLKYQNATPISVLLQSNFNRFVLLLTFKGCVHLSAFNDYCDLQSCNSYLTGYTYSLLK